MSLHVIIEELEVSKKKSDYTKHSQEQLREEELFGSWFQKV